MPDKPQSKEAEVTAEEEIHIALPDGLSPEQRELRSKVSYPAPDIEQDKEKFQFQLFDIFIFTTGIAIGSAGGHWMPAEAFAQGLGILMLIGFAFYLLDPPETHRMKVLWVTLVSSYAMAVLAAVLKAL